MIHIHIRADGAGWRAGAPEGARSAGEQIQNHDITYDRLQKQISYSLT